MVPPLSAQPALRRRELHVQQAAQHELRLAGTCAPRHLGEPLHVDAAAQRTVEHGAAERELARVANVVAQRAGADGEGRG